MASPLTNEFFATCKFVNDKEPEGWNYLHFSKGKVRSRIVQFFNIADGEDEYPCSQLVDSPAWLAQGIAVADVIFNRHESDWGK